MPGQIRRPRRRRPASLSSTCTKRQSPTRLEPRFIDTKVQHLRADSIAQRVARVSAVGERLDLQTSTEDLVIASIQPQRPSLTDDVRHHPVAARRRPLRRLSRPARRGTAIGRPMHRPRFPLAAQQTCATPCPSPAVVATKSTPFSIYSASSWARPAGRECDTRSRPPRTVVSAHLFEGDDDRLPTAPLQFGGQRKRSLAHSIFFRTLDKDRDA